MTDAPAMTAPITQTEPRAAHPGSSLPTSPAATSPTPPPPLDPLAPAVDAPDPDPLTAFAPADPDTATNGLDQLTELAQWLSDGGPVLMVLALLSVVALALVLLKLWQFHRLRLDAREPVAGALALWAQRQSAAAVAMVADSRQPVARLLHRALTGSLQPGIDVGLLREELIRLANAELERLRAYLRALETIATLSPLLGLLGTVLGMIEAFRQLEQAGARVDPALLSGGIWQALLTTAAGLGVAIPVVFALSFLERRVENCGHRMEDAVTRVFTRDLAPSADPDHHGKPIPTLSQPRSGNSSPVAATVAP